MTALISIFLLGLLAIAAISTDFSYEDTRQAFSDGNVPNESELAYEWMLIGSVSSKDKKPVYSADGWFKYSQDNGQYRVLLDFQKKENDPSGRAGSVWAAIQYRSGASGPWPRGLRLIDGGDSANWACCHHGHARQAEPHDNNVHRTITVRASVAI